MTCDGTLAKGFTRTSRETPCIPEPPLLLLWGSLGAQRPPVGDCRTRRPVCNACRGSIACEGRYRSRIDVRAGLPPRERCVSDNESGPTRDRAAAAGPGAGVTQFVVTNEHNMIMSRGRAPCNAVRAPPPSTRSLSSLC